VFARYRSIRAREREYLDVADPLSDRPPEDTPGAGHDMGQPVQLRMATQP
jgi:hypothetical protein